MSVRIEGVPSGPRPRDGSSWRERVAAAAAGALPLRGDGLELDFTLRSGQFIDLDTLVQTVVAGLRDAGVHDRGLPGLDVVLARKRDGDVPGVEVRATSAAGLRRAEPPGPAPLDAAASALPGPRRPGKATWRGILAATWGEGPPLAAGEVWADVALGVPGSILAPLEPVLDALEPVLGRDPRGRDWQEFFPNDDRITWLRVRRAPAGAPALRLRAGPRTDGGRPATFPRERPGSRWVTSEPAPRSRRERGG